MDNNTNGAEKNGNQLALERLSELEKRPPQTKTAAKDVRLELLALVEKLDIPADTKRKWTAELNKLPKESKLVPATKERIKNLAEGVRSFIKIAAEENIRDKKDRGIHDASAAKHVGGTSEDAAEVVAAADAAVEQVQAVEADFAERLQAAFLKLSAETEDVQAVAEQVATAVIPEATSRKDIMGAILSGVRVEHPRFLSTDLSTFEGLSDAELSTVPQRREELFTLLKMVMASDKFEDLKVRIKGSGETVAHAADVVNVNILEDTPEMLADKIISALAAKEPVAEASVAAPESDTRRSELYQKLDQVEDRLEKYFDIIEGGKKNSKTREAVGKLNATLVSLKDLAKEVAGDNSPQAITVEQATKEREKNLELSKEMAFRAVRELRQLIAEPSPEEKRAAAEKALGDLFRDLLAKHANVEVATDTFANADPEEVKASPAKMENALELLGALVGESEVRTLKFRMIGEGATTVDLIGKKADLNLLEQSPLSEKFQKAIAEKEKVLNALQEAKNIIDSSASKEDLLREFGPIIEDLDAVLLDPSGATFDIGAAVIYWRDLIVQRAEALDLQRQEEERQRELSPERIGERIADLREIYPKFDLEAVVRNPLSNLSPEQQKERLDQLEALLPQLLRELESENVDLELAGDIVFTDEVIEPSILCRKDRRGRGVSNVPDRLKVSFFNKDMPKTAGMIKDIFLKFQTFRQAIFMSEQTGIKYEPDFASLPEEIKLSTETSVEKDIKIIERTLAILTGNSKGLDSFDLDLVFTQNPPKQENIQKKIRGKKEAAPDLSKETYYADLRNARPEMLAAKIFEVRKFGVTDKYLINLKNEFPNFKTSPETYNEADIKASAISLDILTKLRRMIEGVRAELGDKAEHTVYFNLEIVKNSNRKGGEALQLSGTAEDWKVTLDKKDAAEVVAVAEAKAAQLGALRAEYPSVRFHMNSLNTFDPAKRAEADANIRMKMDELVDRMPDLSRFHVVFRDGGAAAFKGQELYIGFDGRADDLIMRVRAAARGMEATRAAKARATAIRAEHPNVILEINLDAETEVPIDGVELPPKARSLSRAEGFLNEFSSRWSAPENDFSKFPLTITTEGKVLRLEDGRYVVNIDKVVNFRNFSDRLQSTVFEDYKNKVAEEERTKKEADPLWPLRKAREDYNKANAELPKLLMGRVKGLGEQARSFVEVWKGKLDEFVEKGIVDGKSESALLADMESEYRRKEGLSIQKKNPKEHLEEIVPNYLKAYLELQKKEKAFAGLGDNALPEMRRGAPAPGGPHQPAPDNSNRADRAHSRGNRAETDLESLPETAAMKEARANYLRSAWRLEEALDALPEYQRRSIDVREVELDIIRAGGDGTESFEKHGVPEHLRDLIMEDYRLWRLDESAKNAVFDVSVGSRLQAAGDPPYDSPERRAIWNEVYDEVVPARDEILQEVKRRVERERFGRI